MKCVRPEALVRERHHLGRTVYNRVLMMTVLSHPTSSATTATGRWGAAVVVVVVGVNYWISSKKLKQQTKERTS